MRTSSPCCSPFSWCCSPRARRTSTSRHRWPSRLGQRLQGWAHSIRTRATPPMTTGAGSDANALTKLLTMPLPAEMTAEQLKQHIDRMLGGQIGQGRMARDSVTTYVGRAGLVISLHEAGFFASGSAAVNPASLPMLSAPVDSLPRRPVRVEGHTDDVPSISRSLRPTGSYRRRGPGDSKVSDRPRRDQPRGCVGRGLCGAPSSGDQRDRGGTDAEPAGGHYSFVTPNTFTMTRFLRWPSNSA